jgi:hypothetical protein
MAGGSRWRRVDSLRDWGTGEGGGDDIEEGYRCPGEILCRDPAPCESGVANAGS